MKLKTSLFFVLLAAIVLVFFSCKEDICFENTGRLVKINFYQVNDTVISDSALPLVSVRGYGLSGDADTNYYSYAEELSSLELPLNPNADSVTYLLTILNPLGKMDYYIDTVNMDSSFYAEDLVYVHDTIKEEAFMQNFENLSFAYERNVFFQSAACGFNVDYYLSNVYIHNSLHINRAVIESELINGENGENVKIYY